jgi:hypothetical protein
MKKGMEVIEAAITNLSTANRDENGHPTGLVIDVSDAIRLLRDGMSEERLELGEVTSASRVDMVGGGVAIYLPQNDRETMQPDEDDEENANRNGNAETAKGPANRLPVDLG